MRFTNRMTAVVAATMVLGGAAANAGEHRHEEMKIKVMTDGGDTETVVVENLAVGESREIVSDSGKVVLITRDDEGLMLDVDGKLIDLPSIGMGDHELAMAGQHKIMVLEDIDETVDVDGHVIVKRKQLVANGDEELEIEALLSDLELEHVDGEVVVIRKEIKIVEDDTVY